MTRTRSRAFQASGEIRGRRDSSKDVGEMAGTFGKYGFCRVVLESSFSEDISKSVYSRTRFERALPIRRIRL